MLASTHSFNVELAKKHGTDIALMMGTIEFFCEYHRKNGTHANDGHHWMYNSASSWAEHFPYWSANKIQKLLGKMESLGLIATGNFNKAKYDRTKWYRVLPESENAEESLEPSHSAKRLNGNSQTAESIKPNGLLSFSQMAEPIPIQTYSNTIQSTPIVPNGEKPEIEILDHLNIKRKTLFDSLGFQSKTINAIESNLKPIKGRLKNYTVDEIKTVIDHLIVSWGNDASMRQYLTPASIFRASKFDGKNIAAQEWKLNGSAVGFGRTLNKQEALEAKNSEAGKAFLRKLHGGDTYEHE